MQNYTQASTINKSTWDNGVWVSEPDTASWNDDETNYLCQINRSPTNGSLSCQIGVGSSHAAYAMTVPPVVAPTAHMTTYVDGTPTRWWVWYFDGPGDGQPAINYQSSLYRTQLHVQDHATRCCRELAGWAAQQASTTPAFPDETLPATAVAAAASDETDSGS